MRTSRLFAALLLSAAATSALASSHVDFIPTPTANSPGRAAVVAQLRKLGKEQFKEGKEQDDDDAQDGGSWSSDYTFTVKVLLDTPALFSLDTTNYVMPTGRTAQGSRAPLLFEMKTGHEYDIGRLYRVRDAKGGLIAPVVALVVRHTDPKQAVNPQEMIEWVVKDVSHGRPQLFVTKSGIEVWPEFSLTWVSSDILTWKELRPYLDEAEAKRIGWTAP